VPNIIQVCTGIVEAKGQEVEGIYRLSGNNSNIQRMRVMFNQEEGQIDWSGQSLTDINVVTGLLKLYFRELEVSLIPTAFYEPLLQIAKTPGATSADKVTKMAKVLKPLPEAHKVVLKFLLQHLKLVSTWAEKTKMDVGNLAIVFAPTLLKPPVEKIELVMMNTQYLNSIMEEMINSWDKLF
ncbi:Rho GTPase activation protein, partial [Paraphysoderma sedebokerense]